MMCYKPNCAAYERTPWRFEVDSLTEMTGGGLQAVRPRPPICYDLCMYILQHMT